MGKMEDNLLSKLTNGGYNVSSGTIPYPTLEDIKSSIYYDEVKNVYLKLGGILPEIPVNLRKWDIELEGAALELDEFLHFNRYRKLTLDSHIYNNLPKFPLGLYRTYCSFNESKCIDAGSYGGKWTNDSCEKQFGKGSPPKLFTGNGSPRWKQRAFYDYVKDLTPLLYGGPLVRISIYDNVIVNVEERKVKEILDLSGTFGTKELYELIKERL